MAARLGEFGWNGLVLTPYFGPRVRFNSIITNAPLVANPMYEGPALCQPDRCNLLCTRVCPAEALPEKEREEVAIGGRRFQYSKIDGIRCQYGVLGLVKGSGCYAGVEIPPGPGKAEDMWGMMEKRNPIDRLLYENCFGIICGDFCGRCLHQCPAHIYSRTAVKPKKASA